MYKIDETDRKIVDLLMEDGRMPAAEIARRAGISERTARYRIGRLLKEGIVYISAIPQPRKLGFPIVADVFIEVEPVLIDKVAQQLSKHERVSYVAYSIGEQDISVQIVAQDTDEVYAFATEFIGFLPGVRKTTTSIVPKTLKDVYQWKIPASVCAEATDRN